MDDVFLSLFFVAQRGFSVKKVPPHQLDIEALLRIFGKIEKVYSSPNPSLFRLVQRCRFKKIDDGDSFKLVYYAALQTSEVKTAYSKDFSSLANAIVRRAGVTQKAIDERDNTKMGFDVDDTIEREAISIASSALDFGEERDDKAEKKFDYAFKHTSVSFPLDKKSSGGDMFKKAIQKAESFGPATLFSKLFVKDNLKKTIAEIKTKIEEIAGKNVPKYERDNFEENYGVWLEQYNGDDPEQWAKLFDTIDVAWPVEKKEKDGGVIKRIDIVEKVRNLCKELEKNKNAKAFKSNMTNLIANTENLTDEEATNLLDLAEKIRIVPNYIKNFDYTGYTDKFKDKPLELRMFMFLVIEPSDEIKSEVIREIGTDITKYIGTFRILGMKEYYYYGVEERAIKENKEIPFIE